MKIIANLGIEVLTRTSDEQRIKWPHLRINHVATQEAQSANTRRFSMHECEHPKKFAGLVQDHPMRNL